jgi:solute carrier family 38 (sodium-coupled neutral amino acid transporter), member 11
MLPVPLLPVWTSTSVGHANFEQLAKASTLALISMMVIIVTVISQGANVPREERGVVEGSFLINAGIFQAIGVISFGESTRWLIA